MIQTKFNEIKTTQVVVQFLAKNGGKMNYMKLIKLLYLTDRESMNRWGRTLTGDDYYSMGLGPILSNVLDKISHGDDPKHPSIWHEFISSPSNYEIYLKKELGNEELSNRELDLINEIFKQYEKYDEWEMVDLCHKILPEWEDPRGTSIPIHIEDILKVMDKTDKDIAVIADKISKSQYIDFLLTSKECSLYYVLIASIKLIIGNNMPKINVKTPKIKKITLAEYSAMMDKIIADKNMGVTEKLILMLEKASMCVIKEE